MTTLTLLRAPKISTTVRASNWLKHTAMRTYFSLLSRIRPELARRQAERLFTTPPRMRQRPHPPVPARRQTVLSESGHLAVWEAGPADAPAILLVHGWGGTGAQLGDFVPPLLTHGYRVVWFDQPGHGDSEGRRTTLPQMVRALTAVCTASGPFAAAIGHSLGAAAIALAVRRQAHFARIVLIGAPASISEHMRNFTRHVGISEGIGKALRRKIETRHGTRFADIDRIEELAGCRCRALILHDIGDRHVAFADSLRISGAMADARLIRTHGLGHHRILRDPDVVRIAAGFAAGREAAPPDELPSLPVPAPLF